jgi:CopG family nickel-responsive transcriptional regulator
MQRITISIDDDLLAEIDKIAEQRKYQNRSEAIRDLARAGIQAGNSYSNHDEQCVAALFYVYDHEARELSKRLTKTFHEHHDLSLASLHVHLDHGNCMEVSLLRGQVGDVQTFADGVIAERGVRHGKLVIVPADEKEASAHHHTHPHEK